MKLYTARICPFAQRARLALREKGQPYETVEIDLAAMPEWYLQLSPNRKVPLLELDDGRLVWESAVVAEYVDEACDGPPLMPADPLDRALVRIWLSRCGDELIPRWYNVLRGREEPAALTAVLDEFEAHEWRGGPYWFGSLLSMADLLLFPWFERWPVQEHYRGLTWDRARHPQLNTWREEMHRRPSVTEDACTAEFFVRSYTQYAANQR